MEYLENLVIFIEERGLWGIIILFWYFFFLEFPRYLFFDIVVVLSARFKRKNKKNLEKLDGARNLLFKENPLISVIVPGKNEGKHIHKLVRSLRSQTYRNYELIIIDDGSDDDTYTICKALYANGMIDKYLRNDERGGKASAANLGLRYSKGKYIVHLDADSSLDKTAIEEIILPFYLESNIGAVGGNIKVRNPVNLITNCQALEYVTSISLGRMVVSYLGIYRIISGAFGAFRKDILDLLGGWDIGPGLDGDITVKIRKMGYKIHFAEKSVALTNVPDTVPKLTKQRLRWSKSLVRFRLRKHRDLLLPTKNFNLLNFIASFENIFYSLILDFVWIFYLGYLFVEFFDMYLYILVIKILLYTISSSFQLFFYLLISERSRNENRLFLYVPLMFFYTGYYMRIVRTIAYIKEFFGYDSYNDAWNPQKSSRMAKAHGL